MNSIFSWRGISGLSLLSLASVFPMLALAKDSSPSTENLRSVEFLQEQMVEIDGMIQSRQVQMKTTDDKGDLDDLEDVVEILEFSRGMMTSALRSGQPEAIYSANSHVYRVLESIRVPIEDEGLPPLNVGIRNVVWGGLFGHGIPALDEAARKKPVGLEKAKLESRYLHNPESGAYFSVGELATMSAQQISLLDIRPSHAAWLTVEERRGEKGRIIKQFESEYENGVEQVLKRKEDIALGLNYDMDSARRVLFLKEVYLSATSPKANTQDVYGVDWKIKWGDETAVEPVASRLYMLAGGRATDLTFANDAGPEGLLLVLNEKGDMEKDEEGGDERHAETYEDLKIALEEYYGFDISSFTHSHGKITEENLGDVLDRLPSGGKGKFEPSKLIGREWVAFKESLVELQPKGFIRRVESATMSDPVSIDDRASRGTYLFDLWIANRDVKDSNNKAFYRKGYGEDGKWEIREYSEGHHDLGLALGSLFASGEVNQLRTGKQFAELGPSGKKIRFRQSMIFKPESWLAATWADSMWMARKIASLEESDISEAVRYSRWPDFAQKALVYKLVNRRNRIAELFGIDEEFGNSPVKPPDLTVDLSTPAAISTAEQQYRLPSGSVANEMARIGAGAGYSEKVLVGGQITSCTQSVLVKLLVRHRFPSGLDVRYRRQSDSVPNCEPQ